MKPILLTGASGRLGTELCRPSLAPLLAQLVTPTRQQLDITDEANVLRYCTRLRAGLIVHAAAYTHVKEAEAQRELCWKTNVIGTQIMAKAARQIGAVLVYISTDYVFSGTEGMYCEQDTPGPVANYYALTKLVAEQVVRAVCEAGKFLVIRTSFRPSIWPYSTAFTDVYTSQDDVSVIAPMIAQAIAHVEQIGFDTLHIATERKTLFDLAKRSVPNVIPASSAQAGVNYPRDVSLDCSRFNKLRSKWTR